MLCRTRKHLNDYQRRQALDRIAARQLGLVTAHQLERIGLGRAGRAIADRAIADRNIAELTAS